MSHIFQFRGKFDQFKGIDIDRPRQNRKTPSTSDMVQELIELKKVDISCVSEEQHSKILEEMKIDYIANCHEVREGGKRIAFTLISFSESNITPEKQVYANLMPAIGHLEDLKNVGMYYLDIQECIQNVHKVLMKKLLPERKIGLFSTERRRAEYEGIHEFVRFKTEEDAYKAILNITDQYNDTIDYIKGAELEPEEEVSMYFKLAAWILYNFMALHPFGDGNGRIGRLLASHCLYNICPFPCPTYNTSIATRKDYLDAVMMAHRSEGKNIGALAALLLESCWHSYNSYFIKLSNICNYNLQ